MTGIFVHSTPHTLAILKSGHFIGGSKVGAKLGKEAAAAEGKQTTLFVEWKVNDLGHSLSRLKYVPGDVRGVFVFTDTTGKIERGMGYPALPGALSPLTSISFRALVFNTDDMVKAGATMGTNIEPYVRRLKGGPIFSYFPEDTADFNEVRIEAILKEASLNGSLT